MYAYIIATLLLLLQPSSLRAFDQSEHEGEEAATGDYVDEYKYFPLSDMIPADLTAEQLVRAFEFELVDFAETAENVSVTLNLMQILLGRIANASKRNEEHILLPEEWDPYGNSQISVDVGFDLLNEYADVALDQAEDSLSRAEEAGNMIFSAMNDEADSFTVSDVMEKLQQYEEIFGNQTKQLDEFRTEIQSQRMWDGVYYDTSDFDYAEQDGNDDADMREEDNRSNEYGEKMDENMLVTAGGDELQQRLIDILKNYSVYVPADSIASKDVESNATTASDDSAMWELHYAKDDEEWEEEGFKPMPEHYPDADSSITSEIMQNMVSNGLVQIHSQVGRGLYTPSPEDVVLPSNQGDIIIPVEKSITDMYDDDDEVFATEGSKFATMGRTDVDSNAEESSMATTSKTKIEIALVSTTEMSYKQPNEIIYESNKDSAGTTTEESFHITPHSMNKLINKEYFEMTDGANVETGMESTAEPTLEMKSETEINDLEREMSVITHIDEVNQWHISKTAFEQETRTIEETTTIAEITNLQVTKADPQETIINSKIELTGNVMLPSFSSKIEQVERKSPTRASIRWTVQSSDEQVKSNTLMTDGQELDKENNRIGSGADQKLGESEDNKSSGSDPYLTATDNEWEQIGIERSLLVAIILVVCVLVVVAVTLVYALACRQQKTLPAPQKFPRVENAGGKNHQIGMDAMTPVDIFHVSIS